MADLQPRRRRRLLPDGPDGASRGRRPVAVIPAACPLTSARSSLACCRRGSPILGESAATQAAPAPSEPRARSRMDAASERYILRTGLMLLLSLGSVAAANAVGFPSARTKAGLARDLRHAVFAKVESFAAAEFERFDRVVGQRARPTM